MPVTNDFTTSELDLNGEVSITSPTALVWGPDGRLYVTEVDGDIKVLDVAFGVPDPSVEDPSSQFYVTDAEIVDLVKTIQNYNDDGTLNSTTVRQVTGIDVTKQYDAQGNQVFIENKPAVVMYVTSSDSRIGAGGTGADKGLDTNSGVITRLVQTETGWTATDIVRGLPRSEENHATNGLEVIQVVDDNGILVSERLLVASGGNANTGAPSNNFAGQQEQPYSAAILEVDLDELNGMDVLVDPTSGRSYIYDLPTLDSPLDPGADDNDPFGGNDGINSAILTADSPVQVYSAGYRNAYDVEVTEDGRVFTYDNGANNNWGGRPAGEDQDSDTNATEPETGTPDGYIATNLYVEDNNEIEGNFDPQNWDQLHEVTRSDDLAGRTLSAGLGGAQVYTWDHPELGELELVYGGHPNPTRAEGARAGILYSPGAGTQGALLMVSNEDKGEGTSDYLEVVQWLLGIGYTNEFINTTVVAVDPGVRYSETFAPGFGVDGPNGRPTTAGVYSLVEDANGPVALPSNINDIVHALNPDEGNYLEAGYTDGSLDTNKGSVNGLAEYTSTIFDDADPSVTMKGALFAAVFNNTDYLVIGRDSDGVVNTDVVNTNQQGDRTVAAEKEVIDAGGAPLGLASIGDDLVPHGGEVAFRGSVWAAIYKQNGPVIEILQPGNAETNALLPVYAGQEPSDPTDNDLDGVDHFSDPFEYSNTNGYALAVGEKLEITFDQVNINPAFSGSLGDSGILGAALDGETANRDAKSFDDGFTDPDDIEDGLFDNGGNIIPGGNAPILKIKDVKPGTMVGTENTVRDALHTGVIIDPDVKRLDATVEVFNWVPDQFESEGRVTGLVFGDGTQSNFIRMVFGDIGGTLGIEVGVETNDSYTVLGTTSDQTFIDALTVGDQSLLGQSRIFLTLEISDIGGDYDIAARYSVINTNDGIDAEGTVTLVDGAQVPVGVLRDVLDGTHMISDGDTDLPSGAAIGFVAEVGTGSGFDADFNGINVEAFGNEIDASTAAEVGQSGTPGVDTIIYTGTDTNLDPLDASVENFDGTGSSADYTVTGNDGDNVIKVGAGTNTIVTGEGADSIRGKLSDLSGDTISDFSLDDEVIISDVTTDGLSTSFSDDPISVIINGEAINFDGPDLADFDPTDGTASFVIEDTANGLRITAREPLALVTAINAGGTGTVSGTLRDTVVDFVGDQGGAVDGPGFTTPGATKSYSNSVSNSFNFPDTDLDSVLASERSNAASFGYDVPVENGTYVIDFIFAEIFFGGSPFPGGGGANQRVFDVEVEGQTAISNLDVFQEAGGNGVQLIKSYVVEVTDGVLNINFPIASINQAKVSGIAVWSVGGNFNIVDDTAPVIEKISLENPQIIQDGTRDLTIVLSDETGFDQADFAGLDGSEIVFTGLNPDSISAPSVNVSADGLTATLTYQVAGENDSWLNGATGSITIAAGTFTDAAGNGSPEASGGFVVQSNLGELTRGEVVRAINIGTTDTSPATNLDPDPLDGNVVDNNRYAGAINGDSLITDASGNPVVFEADDASYHTSPKSNAGLNANVDGQSGSTGSNAGGVDLDGSAYHTYRDSNAANWTSTFDGFETGVYVVELHFAELFHGGPNGRVGTFVVNGVDFGTDYDAYVEGGNSADSPSVVMLPVTVTDGTITVEISNPQGIGQPGYSAIVVYDAVDPNLPPTVSVDDAVGVEGGNAEITFTRTGDLSEAVTIDYTVAGVTADNADVGVPAPDPAVIPAGQSSVTVLLPIVDDDEQEGAETLSVTIDSVSNTSNDATIGTGSATVTIAASDGGVVAPIGNTIMELDFEGVTGEPLAVGGFDSALGGPENIVDEDAEIVNGKLVVQTSEGDINDGADDGSANDFTKTLDLSDPALNEIFFTTQFDNPFTEALLLSQGVSGDEVPNFVQIGLVIGTGTQLTGEMLKLVWGGVAGGGITGTQIWTKGNSVDQKSPLSGMVADGISLFDVAKVELSLKIDKTAGTAAQYVTLFNDLGEVIGGVRPEAEEGFATAAPVVIPAAVLANLEATDELTHVGVTSSDNSDTPGSFGSFEATWDFLNVSSPEFVEPTGPVDSVNGVPVSNNDFSDDRLAPTDIGTLAEGETTIVATQQGDGAEGGRERDYFTFTVAEGQLLTGIILEGFETDEVGSPQAFIGFNDSGIIPTDPDTFVGSDQMLGGYVYNSGDVNNGINVDGNIIGFLGDGNEQAVEFRDEDNDGFGDGFTPPLPAGTYTIWLNQGGDPSTVTLKLVSEPVPPSIELSIADAATELETGDTGVTTLVFDLTTADPTFAGTVDITFDTNAASGVTEQVTFANGSATLSIDVANDDVDDGDNDVNVTITGATSVGGTDTFTVSPTAGTATGVVSEDDQVTVYQVGDVVAAFNAGGLALTFEGINFAAANNGNAAPFSGGKSFADGNAGNGQQPVFDDTPYETEVFGNSEVSGEGGSFTFSAAGVDPTKLYYVDLYLAEIFQSAAELRKFDVFVEDQTTPVLDDFDIIGVTGDQNTPIVVRLPEPIAPGDNGAIDLSFIGVMDSAKVSAIVIREAVPVDDDVALVSITDQTVSEDDTEVTLTITRTGNGTEAVTVDYSTADGTATDGLDYQGGSGQVVIPAGGDGTVTFTIPINEDLFVEGDETFVVTIDSATAPTKAVTVEQGTATVTITDNDVFNPVDIDGDDTDNTDDPFAYDGLNGLGTVLSNGGSFRQDFDVDTLDVFSEEAGFTGISVNPGFAPPGASETDPYGDRTTESKASVTNGFLTVISSDDDRFSTGVNPNNTIKDNYQRAVDVTGVTSFVVESETKNPFGVPLPSQFAALGITIGAGGTDDYVKLVFGVANKSGSPSLRIEMAQENSTDATNADQRFLSDAGALGDDAPGVDEIASVNFKLHAFFDEDALPSPAWKLQGIVTLLDSGGAELGTIETEVQTISGSLLDAINGENPLTNDVGGLAYGISITDKDFSGNPTGNEFTGEWDYLEVYGPPTVSLEITLPVLPEDTDVSTSVKVADIAAAGSGIDAAAVTLSGDDADSFIIVDNNGALELHVAAEADIDFETVGSLDVTVTATNMAGTASTDFTLTLGDVNDAPTIELTETISDISEDADTTATTKVATIVVSDDALGAANLGLTGDDADLFVIVDNLGTPELHLIAGAELDDEANGTLDVTVTVDDPDIGDDVEASASLAITVLDGDDDPEVDLGIPAQMTDEDAPFSFVVPADAFADDGGVENLTLAATLDDDTALPAWLSFDPLTNTFSGTPLNADVGTITVKVTADDGTNPPVATTFDLVVENTNDAPTLAGTLQDVTTSFGAGRIIDLSSLIVEDVDVGDMPGLVAELADDSPLPAGITFGADGVSLEVDPTLPEGEYEVRVLANDGTENSAESAEFTLTVGPQVTEVTIEVEDLSEEELGDNFVVKFNDNFSGDGYLQTRTGSGREANIDLSGIAPGSYNIIVGYNDEADGESTASISINGLIGEWVFDDDAESGNGNQVKNFRTIEFYDVTVGEGDTLNLAVARDAGEKGIIDFIRFEPYAADSRPVESAGIDDAKVEVGETFSIDLDDIFTNPDGAQPTYALGEGAPAWLSIDPETGVLSGTPGSEDTGASDVTVIASDSLGSTETTFSVAVPIEGPVRIQAEDADLDSNTRVRSSSNADGGETSFVRSNRTGEVSFDLSTLPPDVYNIRLVYFDESDGESTATATLNGDTLLTWVWDDDGGRKGTQAVNIRERIFENVEIDGSDNTLVFTVERDAGEAGRLDYIEIVRAAGNGAPFTPTGVPDQNALEDSAFDLDLSNLYFDPEEEVLTFTKVSGPEWVTINEDGTVTGTPENTDEGDATVEFTVTDGQNTVEGSFAVNVAAVNDAPEALPISNASFDVGETVNLNLNDFFSDEESETLNITLEGDLPPGLSLVDGVISGTVTDGGGSYGITAKASDGEFEASSSFVINIISDVDTVLIEAEDFSLDSGFFVTPLNAASEQEAIRLPNDATGEATFTFDNSINPGTYSLRVTYFDEPDGVGSAEILASSDGGTTFQPIGTIDFDQVIGSDAPGADNIRSVVFSGVSVADGTILKIAGTSDGGEWLAIDRVELIADADGNFAPEVEGIDDATTSLQAGVSIDLENAFSDPEGDDLLLEVTSDQTWLSIVDGVLVGTPPAAGIFEVTISATDGVENSGITVETTFTLTVEDTNLAPTVAPLGTLDLAEDVLVEIPTAFTDPEGGPLVYSLGEDAPAWASINALGVLTGTPTQDDLGSTTFDVIATDQEGAETADTITVNVANTNDAPVAGTLIDDQALDGGQPFSFTIPQDAFADDDLAVAGANEVLTLSATLQGGDPLPDWISFDPETGTFSGTVPTFQSITVEVTATDAAGETGSQTFAVTSGEFSDNRDPFVIEAEAFDDLGSSLFTSVPMSDASGGNLAGVGQGVSASMSTEIAGSQVSGFYTAAATFLDETDGMSTARLFVGNVLVGEWTFDGVTGTQVFSGEATGSTLEKGNLREVTFDIPFEVVPNSILTLEVEAEGNEFARVDKVTLNPASPPPEVSSAAFIADENQTTVGQVLASPDADSFAIAGDGADNTLFAIDDDGNLSFIGAPNFEVPTDDGADGVYEVSVDATNASGTTNATIEVTVADVNEAPEQTVVADQSVSIGEPIVLPTLDTLFTDPDLGDSLSLAVDQLPSGVTLAVDGITLEGTPDALGDTVVTVTATDLAGLSTDAVFTISVVPDEPNPFGDVRPFEDLDGDLTPNSSDDDVDGDGTLNEDDSFAYDADNGMLLSTGETKVFNFDIDGTIYENGLTGYLQGRLPNGSEPAAGGGGSFDEDTGAATVSGGFLTIDPVTAGDTGGQDSPEDDAQVGVKNSTFTVVGTVVNPWFGVAVNPNSFDQLGLHVGVDSADMVKLVFGQAGGVVEFQLQEDNVSTKAGPGNGNQALPDGLTIDDFASAEITLEVMSNSPASASISGKVTFLDENGDPISGATNVDFGTLNASGDLAAALANPDQGVGVGFTNVNGGGDPSFVAQLDTLVIQQGVGEVVVPVTVDPDKELAADFDNDTIINSADTDIDGDGITNLDDRAAYDANNAGPDISDGTILIDFSQLPSGTSPFAAGFTGTAQTADGSAELDYATNNGAVVTNGRLEFQTTDPDTNDAEQSFTFLAGVDGNFTFSGTFDNPVFGEPAGLSQFSQYGLIMSLTGTAGASAGEDGDFLKLTTGNPGNGFEFSGRGSFAGSDLKIPYPAGVTDTSFAQVKLTVEGDTVAGTLTGKYDLLDASGDSLASGTVGTVTPTAGSAFADVLDGTSAVQPGFGITSTDFGGGDAFTVAVEDIELRPGIGDAVDGPADPSDALAILNALTDVDDNGAYAAGDVGSATLTIMDGVNTVQSSNFGANSFELTNTGDKQISAVFLDFRNALYGNAVIDIDGTAGDNAVKDFAVNSGAGATGAITNASDGETYFFAGDDPLPNTTGTGSASTGGFRGLLLKFDGSDGGFTAGESIGFSGDMDGNSLAGLFKTGASGVDPAAINSWDAGGVSGAELIGSSFTVLFDDGTTATGFVGSDESQAGSVGTAVEDRAEQTATLTVNGTTSATTGTYGGTVPVIEVSGTPGDVVRVTLSKGLNPVTNNTNGVADLVAARLADAHPEFQVNNAADFQTFDVTIGDDGTATVPATAFDYNSPNPGGASFSGSSYTNGYETAPIVVAASVIADDGTPLGAVDRVYLTSNGEPVEGGGNPGVDGFFEGISSGANFRFKVQIEDENVANAGTNPGGKWNYEDAPDSEGRQAGFQGDGYYVFGSTESTLLNGPNDSELFEYEIFVPEGQEGVYDFRFRVSRDPGAEGDQQNDLWLNFQPADQPSLSIEEFLTEATDKPEPVNGGAIKVFGGPQNGNWGFASNVDGEPDNFPAQIEITESGLYTVQIYGRSQGYHVDFWELYKGSTPGVNASDSAFVEGEPGDGGNTGSGNTLRIAVDTANDDWEESGGGGSPDLELGDNGGQQYVGLRFDGISIASDAVIADAYIEFEALETSVPSDDPASFDILIEDSEAAAPFSAVATPGDRTFLATEVLWANVEEWTEGDIYRTPDIADLIEEVIGNDGIDNGSISLLIDGNTGSRVAHPFGSSGEEPTLVIVLEDDTII